MYMLIGDISLGVNERIDFFEEFQGQFRFQPGDDFIGQGRQEDPAHGDENDGQGSNGDVREPVGAGHDAWQGKDKEYGEAGQEGLAAQIAAHKSRGRRESCGRTGL